MNSDILSAKEYRRYQRQIMIPELQKAGQGKLKQAKVLVVGAGGLGCPALQYLAAAGIGTLGIIDDALVDESNLHRQVLYGSVDLGKLKAIVARQRLQQSNDLIHYKVLNIRLSESNAHEIIKDYDMVLDATDNFPTRYLINDTCVAQEKPMIYGAIYKFEGQISVFNYKGGPTYRCLFPQPPKETEAPDPTDIGVIGVLPGIIGTLQANEAIKIILGKGKILSGKMWIIDLFNMKTYAVSIKANPDNYSIKRS